MKTEPEPGKRYIIKHDGKLVEAEFLHFINLVGKTRKHYVFRKLQTGREVILKSRVKILGLAYNSEY